MPRSYAGEVSTKILANKKKTTEFYIPWHLHRKMGKCGHTIKIIIDIYGLAFFNRLESKHQQDYPTK